MLEEFEKILNEMEDQNTNPNVALSIRQPWAWLIVNGYKLVENRKWKTNFRGPFYVHAAKSFDKDGYNYVKENFVDIQLPSKEEFQFGGIIGVSNIVDCVNESDDPWFFGPYGLVLKDSKTIDFIPLKGQLKFFKVNL